MVETATLKPVSFLELEITGRCQLSCVHCYAASGPSGGSGTMALRDWELVMSDARSAGVTTVQFIGGEPTLHPGLPQLMRYALSVGLKVDVYTNLVHVTPGLWALFEGGGVSLGTSWYASDPAVHAKITGTLDSFSRTRANLAEAVRRKIPVRAGIVEVVAEQDIASARDELAAIGLTNVSTDHVRRVGRAAHGQLPGRSQLCGRCGDGRAAISSDGDVSPCVLGRFLVAGNVRVTPLPDILSGSAWGEIVGSIPRDSGCVTCTPADSNDCNPARAPM